MCIGSPVGEAEISRFADGGVSICSIPVGNWNGPLSAPLQDALRFPLSGAKYTALTGDTDPDELARVSKASSASKASDLPSIPENYPLGEDLKGVALIGWQWQRLAFRWEDPRRVQIRNIDEFDRTAGHLAGGALVLRMASGRSKLFANIGDEWIHCGSAGRSTSLYGIMVA